MERESEWIRATKKESKKNSPNQVPSVTAIIPVAEK